MLKPEYDVIVFGGGAAGIPAAIQAGRAGAGTLLVEKNGVLGGTMTVGGINCPAYFFARGRHVVGGIGWELCRRACMETGLPVPGPDKAGCKVSIPVFAALADEAAIEAGVDLLFHAMPASVVFESGGWTARVCSKNGVQTARSKVLIDATGDANVVEMAGFELARPGVVQPASLVFGCSGYDPCELDYEALAIAAAEAVESGELLSTDLAWAGTSPERLLKNRGGNVNHIRAPAAHTSGGRSRAEIEGRKALLRIHRFFRRQSGLENFIIDWMCSETGIRETVTIRGKKTVTAYDYESGLLYEDALCYAFYPVDEHLNDGAGINWRALKEGVLPTIPRGALLPSGSRFMIAAGRCVSSDREANSALRVECPCMAMGQAAGAMAALSARTGEDPEELPIKEILCLIREHGAVVPGELP